MSGLLESRYRRLAGWYPRVWRTRNEDAFVGTLLDVAEAAGRTTPTHYERASIFTHGLTARIDRIISSNIRNAASTIALTVGTGVAFAEFMMSSWAPWVHVAPSLGSIDRVNGTFFDNGFLFAGLWIIALIAALTQHWGIGRGALLVSIIVGLLPYQLFNTSLGILALDRTTTTLLTTSAMLAMLGRPRHGLATFSASIGWALLATIAYTSANATIEWLPSTALWSQMYLFWYGALIIIGLSAVLAIARYWNAAFVLILGLAPLAVTFTLSELHGMVNMRGSGILLGIPVTVGLLLLVLQSNEQLKLSSRPLARSLAETISRLIPRRPDTETQRHQIGRHHHESKSD